ncbi:unnamed protein product [Spirodela intermedia]|uniref:Mitochondrial protein n=1 Tax=Spirodela intermedia TaxID=51605 RepID=A0ABN7ECX3_SPIIN|nr:unnamed protein product [Spirodela intermedia]
MLVEFDMTDLGLLHYFLRLQIIKNDPDIFISQEKYVCGLLKKINMFHCKTCSTLMNINDKLCLDDKTAKINKNFYRNIVGGLMYLTHTHPNILFLVSMISRFMQSPNVHHLGTTKRILRYVCDTINYGILYQHVAEFYFLSIQIVIEQILLIT